MTDEPVEVGRANPAVRVSLTHPSVSRRHARISFVNGAFVLEDLGSANFTFVNKRRISAPTVLADGDQVGFGEAVLQAELRLPAGSSRAPSGHSASDEGPGLTVSYTPESPPAPVSQALAPRPPVSDVDATMNDVAPPPARPGRQSSVPPVHISEDVHQTFPPRVVVKLPDASRPAAEPTVRSLPDLTSAADSLAASLRELNSELIAALQTFDQNGGRAALQAIVAQAQRVEANPRSAQELDALVGWLPIVRRLLETELVLVRLLSRNTSDASG